MTTLYSHLLYRFDIYFILLSLVAHCTMVGDVLPIVRTHKRLASDLASIRVYPSAREAGSRTSKRLKDARGGSLVAWKYVLVRVRAIASRQGIEPRECKRRQTLLFRYFMPSGTVRLANSRVACERTNVRT